MGSDKKIIKDFITEEYKDYIYMCPKGIKADWIIYHDRQSDEIRIKNFKDYMETKEDNDHIRCGVKLIEDH